MIEEESSLLLSFSCLIFGFSLIDFVSARGLEDIRLDIVDPEDNQSVWTAQSNKDPIANTRRMR